jgi:hypothetical protein
MKTNHRIDTSKNVSGKGLLDEITLHGELQEEIEARPVSESPLPGFLPDRPTLALLSGASFVGKTSFLEWLLASWACSVAPWPGAPDLPGTPALLISREQPAYRLLRTVGRFEDAGRALWSPNDRRKRLRIIARDELLAEKAKQIFTLDEAGLDLFGEILNAMGAGSIVGLDSLSRLKPSEVPENDNDRISEWLQTVLEIVEAQSVHTILVHHQGVAERQSLSKASRGATAIENIVQAVWLLSGAEIPEFRRLQVGGNVVEQRTHYFRVCPDGETGIVEFTISSGSQAPVLPWNDVLGPGIYRKTAILRAYFDVEKPLGHHERQWSRIIAEWERDPRVERKSVGRRGIRPVYAWTFNAEGGLL